MQIYLSSRLKKPHPRKQAVLRTDLLRKLQGITSHQITCIYGGAGSGKTTLLATCFQKMQEVTWLTMDEECNDFYVFWDYLRHAIPCLAQDSFLDSCFLNHQKQNWQIVMEYILSLLESQHAIITIDNIHLCQDKSLLTSLAFFLDHLPEDIHMVFSGRTAPALSFHPWLMRNQLLTITQEELRFTKEEALQFLKVTQGMSEDEDYLIQLCHQADGWIGGLQLMSIASQLHQSTSGFTHQLVNEYIKQEIYGPLSKEEQQFLMLTSILRSFDEADCRVYLKQQISLQKYMDTMMITILDAEKQLYTYHDIFKEFLTAQFEEQPMEFRRIYRMRAAQQCKSKGEIQECLHHLLRIPDYIKAMDLITSTPQDSEVLYYLRMIPLEVICEYPDFAYQYYFYFYGNYEEEMCRHIYQIIEQRLQGTPTFAAFASSISIMQGLGHQESFMILSVPELMRLPLKKETITFALLKDAYLLFAQSRYEESIERLHKAQELYEQTRNLYAGMMLYMEYAQIYEAYGHFQDALKAYGYMDQLLQQLPLFHRSYEIGLAGIYIKQLKLEQADVLLKKVEERRKTEIASVMIAGMHTRAQWCCASGCFAEAQELVQGIYTSELYGQLEMCAGILKEYYPLEKDAPIFQKLTQQAKAVNDLSQLQAEVALLYAMLLIDAKDEDKAFLLLDHISANARKQQNNYTLIEADVIKLLLLWKSHHADLRLQQDIFVEAICLGTPEEIRLPFQLLKHCAPCAWLAQSKDIQQLFTLPQQQFLSSLSLWSQEQSTLTKREADVLSLLVKGNSNKEIGDQLFITVATVKTHLINIYGKLGVKSRVEAVNYVNRQK